MKNFFNLYSGHLKSSRRVLIISSIGLIVALTIVSSTNFYFDNTKQSIVESYLANNTGSGTFPDVTFQVLTPPTNYNQTMTNLANSFNKTKTQFNIKFFKSAVIYPTIQGLDVEANNSKETSYLQTATIVPLNTAFSKELNQIVNSSSLLPNSQLPKSINGTPEAFFLFVSNNYGYSINDFNISVPASKEVHLEDYLDYNVSVKVSGIANVNVGNMACTDNGCTNNSDVNKYPALKNWIDMNGNYGVNLIVFTNNLSYLASKVNKIIPKNPNYYIAPRINYNLVVSFDYTKIDPYSASNIATIMNLFSNSFIDKITQFSNGSADVVYNFNSSGKFTAIQNVITSILFILLIVSIPILFTSIFVINYSFGLIYKNVVNQIGIYKTRGATSWLIFFFQVLDNILVGIFSIIIAFFAGVPISMLALRTNYLLSFQYPPQSYFILNIEPVTSLLVYAAIILVILVNLRRVKNLSQIDIIDTENPAEKGEHFWKKHYIDILLFGFGLVMYVLFYELETNRQTLILLGPIIGLVQILVIPAPLALVIGLILVANRFIPVVLDNIGTVLWKRTGNLIAFSFKNITRHRQASTRAVMLISILLTFMILFYTLPYSLVVNNETQFYYQNGAEASGVFANNNYSNLSLNIIRDHFSQYLSSYSPYIILSSGSFNANFQLMLVNTSSYLQTAYLNFNLGLTKGIKQDFKNIQITNLKLNKTTIKSMNILMDKSYMNQIKASIGSTVSILGTNSSIRLNIADSFSHWPILASIAGYSSSMGIGDINYYTTILNKSLAHTPWDGIQQSGILFKFKPGVNQSLIANWIVGNTSLSNINIESVSQSQYENGTYFRIGVGQINNDLILVLVITIIVLIMFSYLQLSERKREIFTERAIGMKLQQLTILFFIETVILTITSLLLGTGMGYFLMALVGGVVLNPLQSYPAFQLVFPGNLIIETNILIFVCAVIVSIVPAFYVSKQDITKSFGET